MNLTCQNADPSRNTMIPSLWSLMIHLYYTKLQLLPSHPPFSSLLSRMWRTQSGNEVFHTETPYGRSASIEWTRLCQKRKVENDQIENVAIDPLLASISTSAQHISQEGWTYAVTQQGQDKTGCSSKQQANLDAHTMVWHVSIQGKGEDIQCNYGMLSYLTQLRSHLFTQEDMLAPLNILTSCIQLLFGETPTSHKKENERHCCWCCGSFWSLPEM